MENIAPRGPHDLSFKNEKLNYYSKFFLQGGYHI